ERSGGLRLSRDDREGEGAAARGMRDAAPGADPVHLSPPCPRRYSDRGAPALARVAIAYETVTDENGRLPLLAPMSEVAGRMSIHVGAYHLHKHAGGYGVLLGGVTGVPPAKVVSVGSGTSGTNAARMAVGLGARVIVLDRSLSRLAEVDKLFGSQI